MGLKFYRELFEISSLLPPCSEIPEFGPVDSGIVFSGSEEPFDPIYITSIIEGSIAGR